MATYAQMAMAGQEAQDRAAFESAHNREQARRTKAGKWGGWGRTLGLLGAGLATAATGGLAAPVAAGLVGLGGLAGRSAGRALAGGRERDADKNIDALFYQGKQREFGKEIGDYQAGMRERMLTDAGRDAFSAYLMGGAGDKIAKWGADKPKFLGDWGAKTLGVGGDKFAAETTAKGLADNPWLAGASDADDLWASGIDSVAGSVNPASAGMNLGPVAGSAVSTDLSNITNPLGAPNTPPTIQGPLSDIPQVPTNYDEAMRKAAGMRTMDHAGRITNPEVLKSLGGLPAQPPQDFLGGMSYDQYSNLSDEAFEAFMNQGQEGNLLNMVQNQSNAPINWNRPGTTVGMYGGR